MADQTQRLEIATVRAEVGSNILYRVANDPVAADPIPTESGDIQNLKQVIAEIREEGAEKISVATTIYQSVQEGLSATADGGIFLVQSSDASEIYTVWENDAGAAVSTGKTALSATAIQTALEASSEAAQAAEEAADNATTRTAGFLAPADSPPVTRDNGIPLQQGDRYFNTAEQAEYLYTDIGWQANDSQQAIADLEEKISVESIPQGIPRAGGGGQINEQWIPQSISRASDLSDDNDVNKGIALISLFQFGASPPGKPRPEKKGFWTDSPEGANIWRFRDRLLVGAAAAANGADDPGADKTWVGYSSGGLMTYFETRSTVAVFSDNGVMAGAFASRSSDQDETKGGPCIGIGAFARNDAAGKTAWAGYFTAVKDNDTVKYTHGVEADVANRGSIVDIDPYNMTKDGQTVAAWIRSGGETAESGQAVNPASACIGIVGSVSSNQNAVFRKGIVFAANAIQNDETGHAPAIVLAKNQKIEWVRDGVGHKGGSLRSDATTSANVLNAVFNNSGFGFFSTSAEGLELETFRVSGNPTAANFIEVRSSNAAGRPSLVAQGADTDIDLAILGKGSGGVRLRDGAGAERVWINTTGIGFFGTSPIGKQVVSGGRGANAALTSLLAALAATGLITNNTTN